MTITTISLVRQRSPAPNTTSDSERAFILPLEHGMLAPATARHAARPVLAAWSLDDDQIYNTLLIISELVTNAVTHARPPVVLHLRLQATASTCGHVQVHVADGGPQTTPTNWAATRPTDERGRGDTIITALADQAGTDLDADGLIDHWAGVSSA
ncbi:ATP-binding protein [Streptomyces virginiae]|uniref:ATP-binding protein n=1 Tax=Streptomyces virginiae TaxID=1961 RepID=UPI003688C791